MGGNAPRTYPQHEARTLFMRVPAPDWARVKIGEKTEFRTTPHERSSLLKVYPPTPVVAYMTTRLHHDAALMVLEERHDEALFDISMDREALDREGFVSYDEFRRYWRRRRHGIYRPMERVTVWRVRPWEDAEDEDEFAGRLLQRLYGEWL